MAVNEKLRDHLHDQLFAAVLELQSIDECYEFFEDICTIQEMRAIAVRLEVARMLKAGETARRQYGDHQPYQTVPQLWQRRLWENPRPHGGKEP